jgi:hypothetical protein
VLEGLVRESQKTRAAKLISYAIDHAFDRDSTREFFYNTATVRSVSKTEHVFDTTSVSITADKILVTPR